MKASVRFDSQEYVDHFLKTGEYPHIHDNIFTLGTNQIEADSVADFGCCVGLLSHRLARVYRHVLGIEPNARYLARAVHSPRVHYEQLAIGVSTVDRLISLLNAHAVTAIFARRVFPEIAEHGGGKEAAEEVARRICHDSSVESIAIEGRVVSQRHTNPLWNVDKEVALFDLSFTMTGRLGNCVILKRRK